MGRGAKANHLTYLGDADDRRARSTSAAARSPATTTATRSRRPSSSDGAFIGSDTAAGGAGAPSGAGAVVAAGTTVTEDVPAGALALTRASRCTSPATPRRSGKKLRGTDGAARAEGPSAKPTGEKGRPRRRSAHNRAPARLTLRDARCYRRTTDRTVTQYNQEETPMAEGARVRPGAVQHPGPRGARQEPRQGEGDRRGLPVQDHRRRRRHVDRRPGRRPRPLQAGRQGQRAVHHRSRARRLQADADEPGARHAALLPGQAARHRRPDARHQAPEALLDGCVRLHARCPLEGLRVLDLSRLIPGPFCTLILSDLGASVDKLEDPHVGDYLRVFPPLKSGLSGRFNALNRDKRIALPRPQEARGARRRCLRLGAQLRRGRRELPPGRARPARRRLRGAERRRTRRIVLCSISGYGQDGPYRDRAGPRHQLHRARPACSGMAGPRGAAPPVPAMQLADIAGGALWGAVGILAALLRGASGRGAGSTSTCRCARARWRS